MALAHILVVIEITSNVAFLTNRLPFLFRICIQSSFISSEYTTEDTQHNLPNTTYFSVDDFNRFGELTNPGEDFTLRTALRPANSIGDGRSFKVEW